MSKRGYGWKPSLPDFRNKEYKAPEGIALPTQVDLRSNCPPVRDQGQLGSCTAFAISNAIAFDVIKQGETYPVYSPLFLYFNERYAQKTINSDSGSSIATGIKSVNGQGICTEADWAYVIGNYTDLPPYQCYKDALLMRSLLYQSVAQNLTQMQSCLASGFPIVVGFTVYSSFESTAVEQTGVVPMPQAGDSVLGGHAVLCVGYDNTQNTFLCLNSWSAQWGMQGFFTIPYAYLTSPKLSSDFWTVQVVS